MASVEVLAGPERRRRWSIEQKQLIVAAAFEPGAVVREVARRCDVTTSLIYRWRRALRGAANGFARVVVAPAGDGLTASPPIPAIEIEFLGDARVRTQLWCRRIWRPRSLRPWRGDDPSSLGRAGVAGGRPH